MSAPGRLHRILTPSFALATLLCTLTGCTLTFEGRAGGPCSSEAECPRGYRCYQQSGWEAGVCTVQCDEQQCAEGTTCRQIELAPLCAIPCDTKDDCPDPMLCLRSTRDGVRGCWYLDPTEEDPTDRFDDPIDTNNKQDRPDPLTLVVNELELITETDGDGFLEPGEEGTIRFNATNNSDTAQPGAGFAQLQLPDVRQGFNVLECNQLSGPTSFHKCGFNAAGCDCSTLDAAQSFSVAPGETVGFLEVRVAVPPESIGGRLGYTLKLLDVDAEGATDREQVFSVVPSDDRAILIAPNGPRVAAAPATITGDTNSNGKLESNETGAVILGLQNLSDSTPATGLGIVAELAQAVDDATITSCSLISDDGAKQTCSVADNTCDCSSVSADARPTLAPSELDTVLELELEAASDFDRSAIPMTLTVEDSGLGTSSTVAISISN